MKRTSSKLGRLTALIAILVLASAAHPAARTLPVYPGTDQISQAVAQSAPGDTILLAASGVYIESDRVKPGHSLSFLAADSLLSSPTWIGSGSRYLRLGGDTLIRGIRFDGRRNARHGIKLDGTPFATLTVDGCTFLGFNEDAITDGDLPIERVTVLNSVFSDIGETALEFRTRDILRNLIVENATFYRIGQYAVHFGGDRQARSVRIEHVTINDCYGGVYVDGVQNATITSSIITNCRQFGVRAIGPVALAEVITHGNRTDYLEVSSGPGCLTIDPEYYGPQNGDFSLLPSSPALLNTARPMGDLRWTGPASERARWSLIWDWVRYLVILGGLILACVTVVFAIAKRRGQRSERSVLAGRLEQAQHLETLGTMTGGVAHDLNNMLGVSMGYLEMAHEAAISAKQTRHLEGALESITSASQLLRQLVNYSAGATLEYRPVDLGAVVDDITRLLRPVLPHDVTLKTELQGQTAILNADTSQLHQVLINLCTNAVDAMPQGGELTIALSSTDPERIDLVVKDTGHGIPSEIADRIFEPFYTTKRDNEGTGMGLSVVKGIVTQHGGQIDVRSVIGEGTTFTIQFPRGAQIPQSAVRERPRVLVVDDDEDFLALLTTLLDREGFDVSPYGSVVSAIEAFTDRPLDFDVVVTDYVMPRVSGSELARKLRYVRPDLPVILVTGYGRYADEEAEDLEFIERIQKTRVSKDLTASIRRALIRPNSPLP